MPNYRSIARYKGVFKNWFKVIVYVLFHFLPVGVKYKDNTTQIIYCRNHLIDVTYGFRFEYYLDHTSIKFNYKDKELKFVNVCNNGSIGDVFVHKELDDLKIENKTVLDIGANIGDSAIFFAINRASKVIAIEPFPVTFQTLTKNIKENHLEDIILPRNYAISDRGGWMKLSENILNTVGTMAVNEQDGVPIPVHTIKDVVEEFDLSDFILKIDCEGCEYDVINSMNPLLFADVSEIFIEYHNTPGDIIGILIENGFTIRTKQKNKKMGLIHGTKN